MSTAVIAWETLGKNELKANLHHFVAISINHVQFVVRPSPTR